MATRKTTEAEPVEPEVAPEATEAQEAPTEEQPLDAVIIVAKRDARGFPAPEVILNGQVQVESVQTLIELGLKSWRKQLELA